MFGFIGWWWKKRDYGEKILTVMFSWIFAALVSAPFIGMSAFAVLLGGIVGTILIAFLCQAYYALVEQINKYKEERDRERQYIVDRLAGRR
jgi:hypothetical protein